MYIDAVIVLINILIFNVNFGLNRVFIGYFFFKRFFLAFAEDNFLLFGIDKL